MRTLRNGMFNNVVRFVYLIQCVPLMPGLSSRGFAALVASVLWLGLAITIARWWLATVAAVL